MSSNQKMIDLTCPGQNKQTTTKVLNSASSLPSFVYYTFSGCQSLKKYISQVKQQIREIIREDEDLRCMFSSAQVLEEQEQKNLHLSLSKILPLYKKQSQLIQANLKKSLSNSEHSLMIPLTFTNITVINNKFIALELDRGVCFQKLRAVTLKIDKILEKWKFQTYFKQPIYHVTLFKVNLNKKTQVGAEQANEIQNKKFIDVLVQKLEGIKLNRMCFNCKQICLKVGTKVHKLT